MLGKESGSWTVGSPPHLPRPAAPLQDAPHRRPPQQAHRCFVLYPIEDSKQPNQSQSQHGRAQQAGACRGCGWPLHRLCAPCAAAYSPSACTCWHPLPCRTGAGRLHSSHVRRASGAAVLAAAGGAVHSDSTAVHSQAPAATKQRCLAARSCRAESRQAPTGRAGLGSALGVTSFGSANLIMYT